MSFSVSDFLTAVTAPRERRIRSDFSGQVPSTTNDFVQAYQRSDICHRMQQEVQQHLSDSAALKQEVDDTLAIVQREKHKRVSKSQPYTVSLARQVQVALKREFQQRMADKFTFWAQQLTTVVMAFIVGSAFYDLAETTSSLFLRGGAALLAFIFPSMLALAETTSAFESRPVLAKHNGLKLFRPTAMVVAQTLADIPVFFPSLFIYGAGIYWFAGFKADAGAFFTFFLFMFATTLTMTSFFRNSSVSSASVRLFPLFSLLTQILPSAWSEPLLTPLRMHPRSAVLDSPFLQPTVSWQDSRATSASQFDGSADLPICVTGGYFITVPTMKPWFAWTRWISPLYYGLEAIISNEIGGRTLACDQLVPAGPGYTSAANQGCTAPGSTPGSLIVGEC